MRQLNRFAWWWFAAAVVIASLVLALIKGRVARHPQPPPAAPTVDARANSAPGAIAMPAPAVTSDEAPAPVVESRRLMFADAPLVAEAWEPGVVPSEAKHVRLVRPQGWREPVRVTERWELGENGEPESILFSSGVVADHVIAQFDPGLGPDEIARLAAAAGLSVRDRLSAPGLVVLATPELTLDAPERTIAALQQIGRDLLAFAETDAIVRADGVTANDPQFPQQWALGDSIAGIHAADGWAIRNNAESVIVAVADSGIRLTHHDLVGNLWVNPGEVAGNERDDDGNGIIDDVHGVSFVDAQGVPPNDGDGHGTGVAGVIGARGDNGQGIAGVAWTVRLMALKFLDVEGNGTTSRAISCIDYAIANGAKIYNASYGRDEESGEGSQAEADAIWRARAAGMIIVASAGNTRRATDDWPHFPSSYPHDNIVAVGAINRDGNRTSFSNYGVVSVDVVAPGESILTLGRINDDATQTVSGTSFAAPIISGMLALVRGRFPGEDYRESINRILASVDCIDAPLNFDPRGLSGWFRAAGTPRLDRALSQSTLPAFPHITKAFPEIEYGPGESVTLAVDVTGGEPLSYQWYRDRQPLATSPQPVFQTPGPGADGLYPVKVANAAGWTFTQVIVGYIYPYAPIAEALDVTGLEWIMRGGQYVLTDTEDYLRGGKSLRLEVTGQGASHFIQSYTTGSGECVFFVKLDFPSADAVFEVSVNGQVVERLTAASGSGWQKIRVVAPNATNFIRLAVQRLGGGDGVPQRVWIDDMRWLRDVPSISVHPIDAEAVVGGPARFEVVAHGGRPLSYVWKRNEVPIAGASGPVFQIDACTLADRGDYTVTVSNAHSAATSDVATLSVFATASAPTRISERYDGWLRSGRDLDLAVTMAGTGPLRYTWYHGEELLPQFAGPNLVLPGVSGADAGNYLLVVAGPGGEWTRTFNIRVETGSAIEVGPYRRAVDLRPGDPLEIAFPPTGQFYTPLTFSWARDGVRIPGAESTTFSKAAASATDAGSYVMSVYAGYSRAQQFGPVLVRVLSEVSDAGSVLGVPVLQWRTTAGKAWSTATGEGVDNGDALRSAPIDHEETSRLIVKVTGPITLSFAARLSSEAHADGLEVLLDTQRQLFLSGETEWSRHSIQIPAGQHELEWAYRKDERATFGSDAAWIDDVHVEAEPPALISARLVRAALGVAFSTRIEASAAQQISVEGLPPGFTFDPGSRTVRGTGTVEGDFTLNLTLKGTGATTTETIAFQVRPAETRFRSYAILLRDRPPGFIRRVIHGAGRFVAVGADKLIAYSRNGYDWHGVLPAGSPANYNDVVFGNGLFIAVADTGIGMISTDGENWVPHPTLHAPVNIRAAAYGAGRFVLVGDLGFSSPSVDGAEFIGHFAAGGPNFVGVAWRGDRFLAVDSKGGLYASPDGASWTLIEAFPCYGDLSYAVIGDAGVVGFYEQIEARPDVRVQRYNHQQRVFGEAWTSLGLYAGSPAWHEGRFWISNSTGLHFSADLKTWQTVPGTTYSNSDSDTWPVCWDGQRLVSWRQRVMSSIDGTNWEVFGPETPFRGLTLRVLRAGRWLIMKAGNDRFVSLDGHNWQPASDIPSGLDAIFDLNGRFVCTDGTTGKLYVSEDGRTWTTLTTNLPGRVGNIKFVNGVYYASNGWPYGYANALYRSTDLIDWTAISWTGLRSPFSFDHRRGQFYAGGPEGQVYTSPDAIVWSRVFDGPAQKLQAFQAGAFHDTGDVIFCMGGNGYIAASTDGTNWSQRDSGTTSGLGSYLFDGLLHIGLTSGRFITVSVDGLRWRSVFCPPMTGANSVAELRGSFLFAHNGYLFQLGEPAPLLRPAYAALSPHQVGAAGGPVVLSAAVEGTEPMRFQWLRNGVALAGAMERVLSIPSVDATTAGIYTLRITNDVETVTTAPIVVGLATPIAPGLYAGNVRNRDGSGDDGRFALLVRENGSASFLALDDAGQSTVRLSLALDETGRIDSAPDGTHDATAAADPPVFAIGSGDGAVVGDLGGLSFYGTTIASASAALHQAVVVRTSDTRLYLLLNETGTGFVLATGEGGYAGPVTRETDGHYRFGDADATYELQLAGDRLTGTAALGTQPPLTVLPLFSNEAASVRLVNISTRGLVDAGEQMMIGGFVIAGDESRTVLVRAAGPTLGELGVGDVLGRPRIELRDSGGQILQSNDGWNNDPAIEEATTRVGAFPFTRDSADAALLVTLPAGLYTAQIAGLGSARGVSLVEVYEVDTGGASRLLNLSTRGYVGSNEHVLIAGFVLTGSQPRQVLIRGVGPALAEFGLTGFLADPAVEIFDAEGQPIRGNDNWSDDAGSAAVPPAETVVGAFPLVGGSRDAVVLIWLAPGVYTVHVRSADGGTGVALAEIYEVP